MNHQISISDAESGVSSPELFPAESSLIRLTEDDGGAYGALKRRFLASSLVDPPPEVLAIHRRNWSSPSARANLLAFHIYQRAVAANNSGEANVKFAWFGASKDVIGKIVAHGFSHEEIGSPASGGVCLFPNVKSLQSVESDEDGIRHVLLCRVLLGNMEIMQPGCIQTESSLDRFDSGVDDVVSPTRYVIWSTNMNTHILPEVVVSFRADVEVVSPPLPTSTWMSFHNLFRALSGVLNPRVMSLVKERYKDFSERRISRDELVRSIRLVAGDNLLSSIIKSSYYPPTGAGFVDGH